MAIKVDGRSERMLRPLRPSTRSRPVHPSIGERKLAEIHVLPEVRGASVQGLDRIPGDHETEDAAWAVQVSKQGGGESSNMTAKTREDS